MLSMRSLPRTISGFTLIELLLAMAIAAVLFGIGSIVLSNLIPKANLNSISEVFVAELRQQQLKAMVGEKNENDQADEFGIYIEQTRYTLFQGSTYDANAASNSVVNMPAAIQLSANPSQTFAFERGTGEILNFVPTAHTITLSDTLTGQSITHSFNRYGIPE